MKKLLQYWREYRSSNAIRSQLEQQEFVLRLILITALLVLTVISILLIIGGIVGVPISTRLLDISSAYFVMLLGLYLVSQEKIKIVRYILIWFMFLLGIWHVVVDGEIGLNAFYFVIAQVFSFMLLTRRRITVILTILAPLAVDLVVNWGPMYDFLSALKYLGFSVGLSFLLLMYHQILELFRLERKFADEAEKVHRAGTSVLSTLDLRETIAQILEQLTNIIPHDSACVLLLEDDNYLEIVGGRGWENPEDVIGIRFPVPGNNPNTVVIETGKPLILGNAPEHFPEFHKEPHNHILSWLGIPLIRDGNIMGMMAIDSMEPEHFLEEHIRILSSFADYVSIAIENALLYRVTHQAVNRRAILHQASQDVIKASADLEEIYNAIYTAANRLMPCDAFAISLVRDDVYEGVFLIDAGTRMENLVMPLGTGLSGEVIATGKSILMERVEHEDTSSYHKFGEDGQVQSLVAVPLKMGDEIMGMMTAQSYNVSMYSEEDLNLLEMLGANAAIAIRNAHLLAEVAHLARTDSLTGLLNRRAFEESLDNEIANAERYHYPVGLLMIDIDDFKQFNDLYGHSMGDEHLKVIAGLILKCVRSSDTVARIGGEEFTVILPHTGKKGAIHLAERIRKSVFKAFEGSDVPGGTVSVGVAIYPSVASSLKDLYVAADKAMFDAKGSGKNQVRAMVPEVSNR